MMEREGARFPSEAPPRLPSRRRGHGAWLVVTILLISLGTGLHQAALRGNPRVPGGTRPGLALGVAAAVLLLVASLIGLRRRLLALPLGSMTWWRRGHLWLGGLALALALLHAGPRADGPLGAALLVLLGLVSASGALGAWFQEVLPGALEALAEEGSEARPPISRGARQLLHGWLLIHVPLAMALLVLVAVHAYQAFRY